MKKIPVGHNKFAIVDDDDYPKLSRFCWRTVNGYPTIDVKMSQLCGCRFLKNGNQMSRIILGLFPKDGFDSDHINHDKLDNRRCNLRKVTRSQNRMNSLSCRGTTSKYKGIYWNKKSKKWVARIGLNGKKIHIGYFDNENHAAHAYNLAAKRYFGDYALLNKVG